MLAPAGYLLNPKHKRYLAYPEYLAAGLPIDTGVIEGTVRHLVQDRMGLTGACWRLPSAEAVWRRLRALRSNQDFDEYWHFHVVRESTSATTRSDTRTRSCPWCALPRAERHDWG